jgi:tetratricopeptide (TPR) repeat protein
VTGFNFLHIQEAAMAEEKSPHTVAEWFEKGRRCFHQPDGVGAVKAMTHVIEMDPAYRHPDGDNPYFYLGKIHEMEDRLDEAVILYSRALAVNPLDEESLIGRGSCYTVTKQHERAIADFTRVLQFPERKRRVPRSHLLYAIAENYRQIEDWEQALYWGRQALEADPKNNRHQELLKEINAKMNE